LSEITRAELGLGLFLGYLITPKEKRVIGEIYVPQAKVEIRSLRTGKPAIAVNVKETNSTTYEKICEIDVPEEAVLSLEELSIYPSVEPDYAVFKIEIGDTIIEGITLATNLVLSLPLRGRVELNTGKVVISVKTSDVAKTVKGHGSINGVIF